MSTADRPETSQRFEISDEDLLKIFATGYASGAATSLWHAGVPQTLATVRASNITHHVMEDPAARYEVLERTRRLLAGEDPGSAQLALHIPREGGTS